MSKVLVLSFITNENKVVKISVQNPIDPVDTTKVAAVMDQLVASGVLQFKTGSVLKKSGATLVDSETTVVLDKQV